MACLKYTLQSAKLYLNLDTILIIIAYARMPLINAIADVSSKARDLNFSLSLHLYPYFVHVSSEHSGEPAHNAYSPKPSLLAYAIQKEISCTGPINLSVFDSSIQ